MTFLTNLTSLETGSPQAIDINGRGETWVDFGMDPSWTRPCEWPDGAPMAPRFLANSGLTGAGGASTHRIVLIDIGQGNTVLVEIDADDPAPWDALIAEAMPIVESFVFAEPGTTP